jgi:hypothetical protein
MHAVDKAVLVVPDYRWQFLRSPQESAALHFFRRIDARVLALVGSQVGKLLGASSPHLSTLQDWLKACCWPSR